MEHVVDVSRKSRAKVVFVLGATATGKSKLAISIAERFGGEVINSDKIQAHDGFPVVTNKVTDEETAGVPHHLLGGVPPDADFTVDDFCREASAAVARVLAAARLPVVAGGSNTYIEALVDGGDGSFRASHDCLFLWTDASPDVLRWYTAVRVDDMVRRGLVSEARDGFDAAADYARGVRRAIGLPEMHEYLLAEQRGEPDEAMLERAVRETKENTFRLACAQVEKIRRLSALPGWDVRRVDATAVFARMAEGKPHRETWEAVVWEPCVEMVSRFLLETATPNAAGKYDEEIKTNGGGGGDVVVSNGNGNVDAEIKANGGGRGDVDEDVHVGDAATGSGVYEAAAVTAGVI